MPKKKKEGFQKQLVLRILAADGPLSHWLSMEKEHVLAWLTCRAKLPHCLGYRLFFTATHELSFLPLANPACQGNKRVRDILFHMQEFLKNDHLVNSQICYIVWNWAFPLTVSWTALYKVSLSTKRYHVSKREEWIISPFLQVWFCALLFLAGMWAISAESGGRVLFPQQ